MSFLVYECRFHCTRHCFTKWLIDVVLVWKFSLCLNFFFGFNYFSFSLFLYETSQDKLFDESKEKTKKNTKTWKSLNKRRFSITRRILNRVYIELEKESRAIFSNYKWLALAVYFFFIPSDTKSNVISFCLISAGCSVLRLHQSFSYIKLEKMWKWCN